MPDEVVKRRSAGLEKGTAVLHVLARSRVDLEGVERDRARSAELGGLYAAAFHRWDVKQRYAKARK